MNCPLPCITPLSPCCVVYVCTSVTMQYSSVDQGVVHITNRFVRTDIVRPYCVVPLSDDLVPDEHCSLPESEDAEIKTLQVSHSDVE